MNAKQAYSYGIDSGYDAGIYGDFTAEELSNKDNFLAACAEICDNKRQYADSVTYDLRGDTQWEAFEHGERVGASRVWRERRAALATNPKAQHIAA